MPKPTPDATTRAMVLGVIPTSEPGIRISQIVNALVEDGETIPGARIRSAIAALVIGGEVRRVDGGWARYVRREMSNVDR